MVVKYSILFIIIITNNIENRTKYLTQIVKKELNMI